MSDVSAPPTRRESPEEDRSRRLTVWTLLLFPLLYAAVGQLLGQDVNWDLQNYHYFDPYWVLVNHMRDVTPAQLQTYMNPLLDVPFYFAAQHLSPRLIGALLAVIQGTSFPLLYLINRHFTKSRLMALGLAGLGMFTAGTLSEVGTVFGDTLLAPLFLAAILLGLHSLDAGRSDPGKRIGSVALIVSGCAIAGVAAGLKLSELPIAVGIAAAFPLVSGTFTERVQKATWAGAALILGCLLSYGWWGYELATRYGSPILPYMNQIFHSPYAPPVSNNGAAATGIVDLLFFPIIWTLHPTLVAGPSFLEASLPIAEVLLLTLLALAVIRTVFQHRRVKVFTNEKQRYLIAVAVVSYLLWNLLGDARYRYLTPIEMLSFTVILVCLQAISVQVAWPPLASIGIVSLAAICIISEQPMNWGRSAWSASTFAASVPRSFQHQSAAFLMLGTNPDSYVVTYFPPQDYFAQIQGNLPPTPYVRRIISKDVSAYRNVFTIWETSDSLAGSGSSAVAQDELEMYGFQIASGSCDRFPGSVGAVPDEFHTCRLTRVSLAKVPPVTRVLMPRSGDLLMGKQVLFASAFAATGLRKVQFSITGEGRTQDVRATLSVVGWLGRWNTKSTPNGAYTVRSIASGSNGVVSDSAGVTVEVKN